MAKINAPSQLNNIMTTNIFAEPESLFKDPNTIKNEEVEFSFERSQLWEKRDSQKQIRRNKLELKLLPEFEIQMDTNEQSYGNDEEGHALTKPCCSIDIPSIDQDDHESSYETMQLERSDSLKHFDNSNDDNIESAAVKLELEQEPAKAVAKNVTTEQAEDNVNVVDITPVLELAKKKEGQKEDDSFEWNNFLVRRACFRGVSVFYKSKFSKINTSWQRKRVNKKKKTHMHVLIREFAESEFGKATLDKLTEEQWVQFRNTLYSILFSHRYKKSDDFLEGVNFDLVRGVLYSYTTETRVELMSNPFFSLLIIHFLKVGKDKFVANKIKGKPQMYAKELQTELEALNEEATSYLKNYKIYEF